MDKAWRGAWRSYRTWREIYSCLQLHSVVSRDAKSFCCTSLLPETTQQSLIVEPLSKDGMSDRAKMDGVKAEFSKVQSQWRLSSDHHLNRAQFRSLFKKFKAATLKRTGGDDLNHDAQLVANGKSSMDVLKPHFFKFVATYYPEVAHLDRLRELSDLSSPAQWFPAARQLDRRFVYHVGPTNSGKTHHALQRLTAAESGIYCAPLRMLAAEIHMRCNAESVPCDLLTGEERVLVGEFEAPHLACTIEMASTRGKRTYDVAVIDEVQMLGDEERGSAWTRVILGVNAREVHVCGNSSALAILQRILATTGEPMEVREYERLSPLVPSKETLSNSFRNVREGDCVVAFSRRKIFSYKSAIEQYTGLQCAVIYGGLPPVSRVEQAKEFNDPDSKYKVLVASDAIGMGLNLNIKRIVLSTLEKNHGKQVYPVSSAQVKQIAGRAGRYRSHYSEGEVTTLRRGDFKRMTELLDVAEDDIEQAGLSPNFEQIQLFSDVLSTASLDEIFELFEQLATLDGLYFLCDFDDNKVIVRELEEFNMSLYDLYTFSYAPIDTKGEFAMDAIRQFAALYSDGKCITAQVVMLLLEIPPLSDSPSDQSYSPEKLKQFEVAHEIIILYLWLGMRYPEHFPDTEEVTALRSSIEKTINLSLHSTFKSRPFKTRRRGPRHHPDLLEGPPRPQKGTLQTHPHETEESKRRGSHDKKSRPPKSSRNSTHLK